MTLSTTQNTIEGQIGELRGEIGELRGEVNGLKSRMDDMHRLMMVVIGVAGGGLITALISLVVQLVK